MAIIKVKGYEFNAISIKDSCNRRALQFKNTIITNLKKLGLTDNDVDINLEPMAMKRVPASATWFMMGRRLHFDCKSQLKYVDNLYVVSKVIELEVNSVLNNEKDIHDFLNDFTEDKDLNDKRIEAREILGLPHDMHDMVEIDKAYKALARAHHPDMENGNVDKFKAVNLAHKVLKRELE